MTEPHKRANRHPKYTTAYRVNNWREYEKSLRDRGDITLWISHEAIDAWTPPQTGKRGAQPVYADTAIETALALRWLLHLPLRQTEGFLRSILTLMDLTLPCPDHTTVSRRNATVQIQRTIDRAPNGCRGITIRPTPRTHLRDSRRPLAVACERSAMRRRNGKLRLPASCSIGCGNWVALSPMRSAKRGVHGGNAGSVLFVQQFTEHSDLLHPCLARVGYPVPHERDGNNTREMVRHPHRRELFSRKDINDE